jgi:hypothetical protein
VEHKVKLRGLHIILFLALLASRTAAQLSPGDLSTAHAKLEGMSNCTQCHDLGDKVSNNKCLACHKEIKSRVDKRTGYHSSKDVKGKDCSTCHSEHHGRSFDLVRFDEKKFNHTLAGYELTGAHKKIDCRECHKPDYVGDVNLKKKKDTFLGLSQKCLDCHTDYHQKTLANDCAKCHTTEDFKPATKFNHDKANFVLIGKHKAVECKECHKVQVKNGKDFQQFTGLAFKNCNACHNDPHRNHLGTDCKQCHNEQSFASTSSLDKFNHGKTNFPLKGKHKQVDCTQCHSMAAATPQNVFQDRLGVKTSDCATCHKDGHEGKFGTDCAGCHSENSFMKVAASNLDDFNHALTGFELQGKHATVDCKKCHTSDSFTQPLPHNTCAACHADFHEGQFANSPLPPKRNGPPDCADCHTTDGFSGSSFSIEQHAQTKFPLDGAHLATPCFACHLKTVNAGVQKWRFRNIGQRCVDCHADIHQQGNEIAGKWYPNQDCQTCHISDSWSAASNLFDHSKTAFQLQGKHQQQECRACHLSDDEPPTRLFAGLPSTCTNCHEHNHGSQFAQNGITDCTRCHSFDGWTMSDFDHDKTRFKLEGKHVGVACEKCHVPKVVDEIVSVEYRMESFECVVCHK